MVNPLLVIVMSKVKKKRVEGAMPYSGAGLIRFFEEETKGIQVKPELIIILAFTVTLMVIAAHILFR